MDYHTLAASKAKEASAKFTPDDSIFANAAGVVSDAQTPTLFIGAVLCDRFTIERYIESGAFGLLLDSFYHYFCIVVNFSPFVFESHVRCRTWLGGIGQSEGG
jgi:hypothetical protein